MGKYTVLDDPQIDLTVEGHMRRIVEEITSRMTPDSIILRGSFGRGEGSVLRLNGKLVFLSDYEIDVTTTSPLYRSLFAKLSSELTKEFSIQVGIRWMRPDCLTRDRIGPFPTGKAKMTISLYEFRYGSIILWGRDIFFGSPGILPESIDLASGLRLLLNRMAESLFFMKPTGSDSVDDLSRYYWINKTILACSESLLLIWKQYHYSYQERGKRFSQLAQEKLAFVQDQVDDFIGLVTRATEFKLRPQTNVYRHSEPDTWISILPLCEVTLQYLMKDIYAIKYKNLNEYSDRYLELSKGSEKKTLLVYALLSKSLEIYRAIKSHQSLPPLWSRLEGSEIVYSVVPLIFLSYASEGKRDVLIAAREKLNLLDNLGPTLSDPELEWDYLRQKTANLWKTYCY